MNEIKSTHKKVGEFYAENVLEYEKIRLEEDSPIEYNMMLRLFDKYIKESSVVLDQGVGVGHYADYLARKSCKLHLLDVTKEFVDLTEKRLKDSGFEANINSSHHASAVNIPFIKDSSVDVVLLLGPLYHMPKDVDRHQTVMEANRVLKKGGLIMAAAINRLGYFRELFDSDRFFTDETKLLLPEMRDAFYNYINDGVVNAEICPFLGDAHLSTTNEFLALFRDGFEKIEFRGLESFTSYNQRTFHKKNDQEKELFLDLVDATGLTLDGISMSEHFIYIGQKK